MGMSFKLTVETGQHPRSICPVTIELPVSYDEMPAAELRDAQTNKAIPCQVAPCGKGVALTWLVNGLAANSTQVLLVQPVEAVARPTVILKDREDTRKVDVLIRGKLFTSYHYGNEWVRPFLHPVVGPYGAQVTRNWPVVDNVPGEDKDHKHHKSIWVAYGECDKVDNWSEEEGHGWQRHRGFLAKVSGPVYGRIVAKNDWCTAGQRKQFEEIRDMCFYALPDGLRLFDIIVTFRMTERAVTFRDTKEGGLVSVRVASSMNVGRTGRIENSFGGVNEPETWGKNAHWCDYSGVVDGKHVGIAILDHETNPRYPTGWHVRNYGLMTANCFAWKHYRPEAKVKGDMTFKKGSSTAWRYRLWVHKGDARQGRVAERFLDFVAPPKVHME